MIEKGSIYKSALLIAVVWGLEFTGIFSFITVSYVAYGPDENYEMLTGVSAVRSYINAYGMQAYIASVTVSYIQNVIFLFVGCVLHGLLLRRKNV